MTKRETEAVKQIAARAKCPRLEEIFALYERQDSAEARFVKKLDKLEAVLQARYYDNNKRSRYFTEKREYPSLFAEFEHNARPYIGALTEKIEKLWKKLLTTRQNNLNKIAVIYGGVAQVVRAAES